MKGEIWEVIGNDWPVVQNNRRGYYRLDVSPEKISINEENLLENPDYEVSSLVIASQN